MQPHLHQLVSCVRAPAVVLSAADGQIRGRGVQGLLVGEIRLLSRLELTVGAAEPAPIGHHLTGPSTASFSSIVEWPADRRVDPTVRVVRDRTASVDGFTETIRLVNDGAAELAVTVAVDAECDFAPIGDVRRGDRPPPVPPLPPVPSDGAALRWASGERSVRLEADPGPADVDGTRLTWRTTVPARTTWTLRLRIAATGKAPPFPAPSTPWTAPALTVRSADAELGRFVARSLADLDALRLTDPERPTDVFFAAGSPWYFTLFGRDSLWTARMLLPLDVGAAAGTLRTLARRQGRTVDHGTSEEPGKILHELREAGMIGLPPLYYGTIDATALWVCLLHDAWRWGMPADEVADLLDPLRAALDWVAGHDDFLAYVDRTGTGLANQGWKDSHDGIQWADGTLAEPPVALCEAQAYAHEAAVSGAAVLEAFGHDGSRYREWADRLRERFRRRFWVADELGPYPAVALDGTGRPVACPTSNLGHLLGTGLLDAEESALVAARLAGADLDCGYGLRTMSHRAAGFNPLGYHTGSVWPHDTAIAVHNLVRAGHGAVAASLARGLVAAAGVFDHRVPELYAVDGSVLACPVSCRPQAWSAAAAVALLQAAAGLSIDVPNGTLRVAPDPAFAPWFPLSLADLRICDQVLSVEIDTAGRPSVATSAQVTVIGVQSEPRSHPQAPNG